MSSDMGSVPDLKKYCAYGLCTCDDWFIETVQNNNNDLL